MGTVITRRVVVVRSRQALHATAHTPATSGISSHDPDKPAEKAAQQDIDRIALFAYM